MPRTATPTQIFPVAGEYGVGYTTLVNHLLYSLEMISRRQREALLAVAPKRIKSEILGRLAPGHLVIVDRHWTSPTIDTDVGSLLVLPSAATVEQKALEALTELPTGRLYRAVAPGITRVATKDRAAFIRVSPHENVGLAEYRHMEHNHE